MDGALKRIQDLCKRENITIKAIEETLGFSNGTIGKWKKAQDVPYGKIKAVADLLNSTPEFILYGKLNVHKSVTGKEYYFDDQTAKLAEELKNNPKMNMFMSSTQKLSPDQFKLIQETIRQFLKEDGIDI